jgi:peroxiredoxin Q/BCP
MKAQDFNLADQNGKMHKLSDYSGKWLVLYFYPKDFTPGCTKQACTYRDFISEIRAKGAEVVGVSRDSVESHRKFYQEHHLNFDILSDEKGETIKKYGVFKGVGPVGLAKRTTFLIDPEGEIKKVYENVDPSKDATNILNDLKSIASGS